MKRGLLLGFLLFSVGAVAYLLLFQVGGRAGRSGASTSERRLAERAGVTGDEDYATAPEDGDGTSDKRRRDNDPNRIDGPELTIRGVVMRGDKPAPNASASLFRAQPRHELTTYRSQRRLSARAAQIEIARTRCDAKGRFEMTIARRSELMIFADAPGASFAWIRLLIPPKENPKEITIQLGDANALSGLVVDEKRAPAAGVPVSITLNDSRSAPLRMDATTNEQGHFRFEGLRAGGYWVAVDPRGFPNQRRYVAVPATSEVLFELAPGGVVVGKVTNSNGNAIADATLSFQTGDSWGGKTGVAETKTDSGGEYRIPHVLPGPLRTALLEHPDYGVRSSRQDDIILPTDLVEVGKELRFDIELPAGVTVRGIVVHKDSDQPVPGAELKLLRMTKQYQSMAEVSLAKADGEGRFQFQHVSEGTYGIEAAGLFVAREAQRRASGNTPLTIDFFVDGKTPPEEQRVVVTATGIVRGTVEGVTPETYRNTGLAITVGRTNRNTRVDAFGAFEFTGVPPTPETTVRSWNPQITSDPFEVKVGEVTEIVLKPKQQGGWAGVVKDPEGNPLQGVKVNAIAESRLKSQLRNLLNNSSGQGTTDAQGRFLIPIQESTRKNQGNEKWFVAAVDAEHKLALSGPIKMPPEGQTTEVELQLEAGGVITGHVIVLDGGSPANLRVSANPKREKGQPYEMRPSRYVTTDIDGSFELRGLGDGVYRIFAWAPGGRSRSQEAAAGDSGVRIEISPTESIAGVVVDEDGFPIKQGRIVALIPKSKGFRKRSGSVREGRFRISNLPAGSYEIEVSPQNQRYGARGPSFEVKRVGPIATGTENVVITVSWGNTLEGRVVGPRGRALGGITVIALPIALSKTKRLSRSAQRRMAMTDGRGDFILKGMGLTEVELVVFGPGYRPTSQRAVPGSGDVTIHMEKGEVIEGKILKADGKPLPNQWFSLRPVSPELQKKMRDWQQRAGNYSYAGFGSSSMSGGTDGQGKFQINNLIPGQYKLTIRTEHGVAPDTTLQTGSGSVTIQLRPALTITGIVLDPGGGPPVVKGRSQLYVGAYQGNKWIAGGQTDGDGNFTIKGLPAGNVKLRVWAGSKYRPFSMQVHAGSQGVRAVLTAR